MEIKVNDYVRTKDYQMIEFQDMEQRIKQLENNRDKAIEIIKKDYYKLNSRNIDEISDTKTDIRITLYNILKGDSDE